MAAEPTVPASVVPPPPTLPRLLTDAQVAEILCMTPGALRDLRSRGGGPPVVRLGARIRYVPRDVFEWIAEHREQPKRRPKA